jgi:hypothetical protein
MLTYRWFLITNQKKNNLSHKPAGGDKKVFGEKLNFKKTAQSKVGSTEYINYKPGNDPLS